MRFQIVLVGALLLLGCDRSIEEAQKIAADGLKDPAATQFRNVEKGTPGFVCGELNGKNSYGAYVGFKRFYVDTSRLVHIEDDSSSFHADEWLTACDRERFPTAELRKLYTDSVKAAYDAEVQSQRPGKEMMINQLRRFHDEYPSAIGQELVNLFIRGYELRLTSNVFPAIGYEPSKVMYRKLCRELTSDLGGWEMLHSTDAGKEKGFREATEADCTPY